MMTNRKVAFITGTNRDVGLETARELWERGIAVVLGARDRDKGQIAARALKRSGIEADALEFDVLPGAHHRTVYR
jgi:NAD(P)-dependent dehydrogenase (short-subunit alcohol dehydrogenase family)